MIDLLKKNNRIIINTDIDGILSAYVLCKYCGCEIVGFSNSAECVWWRKEKISSIYDAVYVDMYIPRKDVLTIDQHIIAYDAKALNIIKSYGTKVNPNLDNPRTFIPNNSYYVKYPFGTIHYILAKLGKHGIDIPFDLTRVVDNNHGDQITIADLILRADDAMTTPLCSNYTANAIAWWKWLRADSNDSNNIISLLKYLKTCPRDSNSVYRKKSSLAHYFTNEYGCDSPDGGFSHITDAQGFISPSVTRYIKSIFTIVGGRDFADSQDAILSARFETTTGTALRTQMTYQLSEELITNGTLSGNPVFSYGYVRSANRPANFSYTIMH